MVDVMDINKERKLFQDFLIENFDFEHHEQTYFDEKTQCYENDHGEDTEVVNVAWEVWKAAKQQTTPEGFVFNDVFAERKRQIDQEHYSHEHDDEYDQNELIRAASSYLSHVIGRGWVFKETCPETYQDEEAPDLWPWDLDFWKPKNPRRDLVRAAALIIAEIEKIDRSTGAKS